MFFLHAKSLANSQILSKNRFLSANPEAFVETKRQLFFPRIQTVRKKPTNENLFFFLWGGLFNLRCILTSWSDQWKDMRGKDEDGWTWDLYLGKFQNQTCPQKQMTKYILFLCSTNQGPAPPFWIKQFMYGSYHHGSVFEAISEWDHRIRWDISCSETSKLVTPRIQSNDKQNRKNIPAFLRNNNIASINFKPKHNITMIATQLFWSFTKEKIKWAVQNPACEFVQTCVNPAFPRHSSRAKSWLCEIKLGNFVGRLGSFWAETTQQHRKILKRLLLISLAPHVFGDKLR